MKYPDRAYVLNYMLDRADTILIHVDCDAEGVEVPEYLRQQPTMTPFRLGYALRPAIPDLEITDEFVACSLTFSGVWHHCIFPWGAIGGVTYTDAHAGTIWMQPPLPRRAASSDAAVPERVEPERVRPHLRLVD